MPRFSLAPLLTAQELLFSLSSVPISQIKSRAQRPFSFYGSNKIAHFGPLLSKLAIDRVQHLLKECAGRRKNQPASKRTTCSGVACTANNEVDQSASRRDIDIGKHDISISPPFCSSRQLGWLFGSHAVPRALGTAHTLPVQWHTGAFFRRSPHIPAPASRICARCGEKIN
jgi:hypothetical protein